MVFKDEVLRAYAARISERTGVSLREIIGQIREHTVLGARLALILCLRKHGYSTPTIGKLVNRDHSTICSAIATGRKWYANKPEFRALVDEVMG